MKRVQWKKTNFVKAHQTFLEGGKKRDDKWVRDEGKARSSHTFEGPKKENVRE